MSSLLKTFLISVYTRTKKGIRDPQSEVIEKAINSLNLYSISNFCQGKVFNFHVQAESKDQARGYGEEISNKVLSNPQIESYTLQVEEC